MFIAAFGAWQLIAGPLSDRFGRYRGVVAGAFTYCAASVLGMFAPSLDVLIAGRILQAVGALTLTICACGLASAPIAFTLVRKDGDISVHG